MPSEDIYVNCPHCHGWIIIDKKEINCNVFRHAISLVDFKQIDPHASKEYCDAALANGAIYGCGKPFKLSLQSDDTYTAVACEYI